MKKLFLLFAIALIGCGPTDPEVARWEAMAEDVTITRDDWGIAHVYGPTDAHAVFGMIYAQAEDDFNRVEVNFLNSQGRLAEWEGESAIWRDLRMKLFIDPEEMQAMYAASPEWLRDLMDAWADGLNFYLHTHPEVEPKVLDRFEPWMALTFSEGSIGGDIERVSLRDLEAFYTDGPGAMAMGGVRDSRLAAWPPDAGHVPERVGEDAYVAELTAALSGLPVGADAHDPLTASDWVEPNGSNGFAIAPSNSATGNALLLINPHTSFYFRSELHMKSDEGLDAYGAVTWGQFFVYQGFNEDAGWMHTSSGVDNIDEFLETVVERDGQYFYVVDGEERPMETRQVTVPYHTPDGMAEREFTVFRTHHGPIVRSEGDRWISVALMEEPMSALMQSYGRTKARNLADYRENMEMHTNSSNNTVYADSEGNIAYWHSNFVPVRNPDLNWLEPVDGSVSANDWGEPHSIDETPNVFNPPVGWIQNTNNWPFSAAGPDSPDPADFAPYFERDQEENARGVHAIMVLEGVDDFTLETLRDAAYDSYQPAFEPLIPALVAAYDRARDTNPLKIEVAEQIELLRDWDYRWGVESVETALAIYWAEDFFDRVEEDADRAGLSSSDYARRATVAQHLESLVAASTRLEEDFGSWRTPWGEINRFQRLTGDIIQPHDDDEPSIPVGFTSGRWGSLASFGTTTPPGQVRRYGRSGNSFVAVVEFGDSVRALAVTAGGESGDPESPHFDDQAQLYADGELRPVYYYPDDIAANAERVYNPGG
ncbi:MAG: penicillin acylase family protein [Longimicrobiales bacterium]|nr:penicillin acylase family protein [Longimicrobiales bacterium]